MTSFATPKIRTFVTALAATAFLVGCQSRAPVSPNVAITPTPNPQAEAPKPATPKVASVEGKWVPANNEARKIYYNEFRKGKFGAYSADGGSTLALGSYTPTANGATLKYFSQTNKREVKATCIRSSATKMTCTTDSGNVAELVRA